MYYKAYKVKLILIGGCTSQCYYSEVEDIQLKRVIKLIYIEIKNKPYHDQ